MSPSGLDDHDVPSQLEPFPCIVLWVNQAVQSESTSCRVTVNNLSGTLVKSHQSWQSIGLCHHTSQYLL